MSPNKHLSRGKLAGAVLVLVVIVIAGFIASDIAQRARAMRVPQVPAALIAKAGPGARIEPVVKLDAPAARSGYAAEMLQSIGPADFRTSGLRLEIVVDPAVSFVMGGASDLKPGAVAQVRGTLDSGHRLHADRIVLLTHVVRVTGQR